ncbi:hypothetical protein [Arenimonas sp.]|uniref:hypothetical protein n=1 Tax=Arenimonas sp. TaxID=1872635 RepID=UPI0037BF9A5D
MFIDNEWGVEIPIAQEDGSYLKNKDLDNLKLSINLKKLILLWSFARQNELNWHNPNDNSTYLPEYYFDFIQKLESEIILQLKNYNIQLIANLNNH